MGEGIPNRLMAVDCHAHISSSAFDSDRDVVLAECAAKGVLVVDSALNRSELAVGLQLTKANPWVKLSAGWEARSLDLEGALEMVKLIEENQEWVVAVGEVGLDRYWVRDRALWAKQEEVFRVFIGLADRLEKPLVVHSRSAGEACVEILLACGFTRVLMHAFDGSASVAARAAEKGFLFSIPPSIVRSDQKKKLVRRLDLKSLTLESDSPVLGPEKGSRNLPTNVFVSAQEISRIKNLGFEEVLGSTRDRALRFFGLDGVRLGQAFAKSQSG